MATLYFFAKNEFLDPKKPYLAVLGMKIGQETAENNRWTKTGNLV